MIFRPYKHEDGYEILKWIKNERELRLWSADRYGKYPINPEDITNNYSECEKNSNFYAFTLEDEGKVIGHLIMRNPGEDSSIVRLGFIIVDSSIRGKGYGKKLILEAIKYAKDVLRASEINLGVFSNNEGAYRCYKAVGFEEVLIEKDVFQYNEESWDCIEMKLKNN